MARTIWAHAHGLVSIYHRGLFRIDEAEFCQLFLESSWRLMEGLAEPEFAEAMGANVRATIEAQRGVSVGEVKEVESTDVGEVEPTADARSRGTQVGTRN